jgi:ASC-1-like (ASCH) protein/ribosomal protein S18 acetylase RimI-like enzyme
MQLCFNKVVANRGKEMNDEIIIREAQTKDFEWVESLMQNALEAYYGGDHRAHAKRIFDAHLSGGIDHLGFFSFEQKMFIAEVKGVNAGTIHIVGKRQSTYKISPLIVISEFRGRIGIGSLMLDYAERYAQKNHARQLYCTVAEQNLLALQFFLRKGFIRAGCSESQYKIGINETMLYKPLYDSDKIINFDRGYVSVLPMNDKNEKEKKQITELLLSGLQESFEGINKSWIESLFEGYSRRSTYDINAKYKLIYVATDGEGKVVGVAGATPKKGSPIKVMPLIATSNVAFEALLIDIPHQLIPYGRKLYIHINPTAEETISLQRLGWKLNAAMPSAYHQDVVTQQWSLDIGETTMRTMRIKQRFFDLIKHEKKTLEVRVGYESINRIQIGEHISLETHTTMLEVKVAGIRKYRTFEEMLKVEDWKLISPDSISEEDVLALLKRIYPSDKQKLGVIVLEFVKIKR